DRKAEIAADRAGFAIFDIKNIAAGIFNFFPAFIFAQRSGKGAHALFISGNRSPENCTCYCSFLLILFLFAGLLGFIQLLLCSTIFIATATLLHDIPPVTVERGINGVGVIFIPVQVGRIGDLAAIFVHHIPAGQQRRVKGYIFGSFRLAVWR